MGESLPPCRRCGKATNFVVGVRDFSKEINAREKREQERNQKRNSAAKCIQKNYRAYLRRAYSTAAARARKSLELMWSKASTAINRIARGRLARRRYKTEKRLRVIRDSHSVLLAYALKPVVKLSASNNNGNNNAVTNASNKQSKLQAMNEKKKKDNEVVGNVYWYKRSDEVSLLYEDYVLLCGRTGFQPPRFVVEHNIAEICRRIIARKNALIRVVQKRWRGFMCRRIVKFFRQELVRLREWLHSRALKLQRAYRGHHGRVVVRKLRELRRQGKEKDKYLEEMYHRKLEDTRTVQAKKLMEQYNRERREEYTAYATSKFEYSVESGGVFPRMKAFSQSVYAQDALPNTIDKYLEIEGINENHVSNKIKDENSRKRFINKLINDRGPHGYGNRSYTGVEIEERKQKELIEVRKMLKHSASMLHYTITATSDDVLSTTGSIASARRDHSGTGVGDDELSSTSNTADGKTVKVISGFDFSGNNECSRSKAMRTYFAQELSDLTFKLIERTTHDHTRRNLLSRFQEYNKNKLKNLQQQQKYDRRHRKQKIAHSQENNHSHHNIDDEF